MAVLSFSSTEGDTVFLRNAILMMIVSRAQKYSSDPADFEDLEVSKLVGAISFDLLEGDQWTRLVEAVYQGTQDLKREVTAGIPTEEPVRAGTEEKLDELLALISCFLYQDRDKCNRQSCPDGWHRDFAAPLPADIDPDLEFMSTHCGGWHFLVGNPHTFTGRMAAWYQDQRAEIAVSLCEMTYISLGASFWIRGFLSGSEPPPPVPGSPSGGAAWEAARREYRSTGQWPGDESYAV